MKPVVQEWLEFAKTDLKAAELLPPLQPLLVFIPSSVLKSVLKQSLNPWD